MEAERDRSLQGLRARATPACAEHITRMVHAGTQTLTLGSTSRSHHLGGKERDVPALAPSRSSRPTARGESE